MAFAVSLQGGYNSLKKNSSFPIAVKVALNTLVLNVDAIVAEKASLGMIELVTGEVHQ